MNETTENLWRALENYTPPETKPTVWKLVYDLATGKPLNVTIEETDQPYIEITRDEANTYPHQDPRVSIVDGKIVRTVKKLQSQEIPNILQIVSNKDGDIATDSYNMLIINNSGKNRWKYD
jgi:hypothetical protein